MKCPKCNLGVWEAFATGFFGEFKCGSVFKEDGTLEEQSNDCIKRERNILRRRVKQLERLTRKP